MRFKYIKVLVSSFTHFIELFKRKENFEYIKLHMISAFPIVINIVEIDKRHVG